MATLTVEEKRLRQYAYYKKYSLTAKGKLARTRSWKKQNSLYKLVRVKRVEYEI